MQFQVGVLFAQPACHLICRFDVAGGVKTGPLGVLGRNVGRFVQFQAQRIVSEAHALGVAVVGAERDHFDFRILFFVIGDFPDQQLDDFRVAERQLGAFGFRGPFAVDQRKVFRV